MTQVKNNGNIPLPLAVMFLHDDYDHQNVNHPKTLSVTTLLKPIQEIILSQKYLQPLHKYSVIDLANISSSSLGSAMHSLLEKAWSKPQKALQLLDYPMHIINNILINPEPNELTDSSIPIYIEQRTTKQINGWNITGKFDLIFDGYLYDLKYRKAYSYLAQSNKEHDTLQGSMYRWLNPEKVLEDWFSIVWILSDWNKASTVTNKQYPPNKYIEQRLALLSTQATERFITDVLDQIEANLDKPDHLLPKCSPEDLWMDSPIWKYYKTKGSNRSTKNYDNEYAAITHFIKDGAVGEIIKVQGNARRCEYCSVNQICSQVKELKAQGLIDPYL
jgi:hypothetical protein